MSVETSVHGSILEIRLARPPVNALDPSLIGEISHAVEQGQKQRYEGIILSGAEGLFSAGLDVPALMTLDRAQMGAFWRDFSATMRAIAQSSVPIVAAITGHSPAGGAVLAIWCDYRIMAEGDYRIGLNETQVGLAIPPVIVAGLQRLVGAYRAERLVTEGSLLEGTDALRLGLVDQLAPVDRVVDDAKAWLSRHLALPRHAFLANREIARRDLVEQFEQETDYSIEVFLDGWFSEQTQASLHELVTRLKSKH